MSFIKKVKIVTFLVLLFAVLEVNAQTFMLSGKVVNESGTPLAGASILIEDLDKGGATDFDGNFQLALHKGTYVLKVSYIGFKTIDKIVTMSRDMRINIVLAPNQNFLDEVLVSAVRVKADAPVSHSNLTKKEIAKRNLGQDIPILMKYLPNVISSSDAGAGIGYTYMRVRGSDASRINVTVNGIPYNDAESQGTFWVNMGDFASSTQSLQLQRGVGTSTNGSGAFGASLNILTDAMSEKAGGEISNAFGSYGTRKHTVKYTTGKLNDHFELSGRFSNIYSDGYVDRAFTDLKSYFLQGNYTDDNTLVKVLVFGGKEQTYQAWAGLNTTQLKENRRQNPYTYENETDNYQQDHYQVHWNEKLNSKWSTNVSLNYTRGKGYFEQFKEKEKAETFNNLIVDDSDIIVNRWLDNHFYVANGTSTYKSEKVEFVSGLSYSNYKNDHYGEVIWGSDLAANTRIRDRYYESSSKKTDWNIFSKVIFNLSDRVKAYIDMQGRFVNYKTVGLTSKRKPINVDTNFNFFNPKAGITYDLNNQNSFYLSYARANREPNRNDFEGGTTQHESLHDYELGWRLKNDVVKLSTNVYLMDYQNQLVLTGAIDDVGGFIRATSGESYRLGLEVDADIMLSTQVKMQPNIAFSQNKNRNFYALVNGTLENLGNTTISNSPSMVFGNTFVYQPTSNLQLAFLSKYVGDQYMGNLQGRISDSDKLEDYFTSDFNIVYEIKTNKIFKSIVLTGLVNNIFNKKYVDRGYYYTYEYDVEDDLGNIIGEATGDGAGYYPQATRNFLLSATLKF
ncbi:TonB-dependent receptor [Tenacibaculum maritimum]|uniref:TonB-dependent receptor n=1 Tax=Tenacibaculum maritimum TaxID=107401 RepID=UPI003875FF09